VAAQDPLHKSLMIGEDTLKVFFGDSIIYMTVDQMTGFDDRSNFQQLGLYAELNGQPLDKNRRGYINEEKKVLDFYSTDTSLVTINMPTNFLSQGFFTAKTVGRVELLAVWDGADTLKIPLRLEALDIESSFADNMIEDFIGSPDRKTNEYVPYGKQVEIDGIPYDTEKYVKGIRVKHWMYNEYPGAVLVIEPVDAEVHVVVRQPGWVKVAQKIFNTY
jgi:hypothetical protein